MFIFEIFGLLLLLTIVYSVLYTIKAISTDGLAGCLGSFFFGFVAFFASLMFWAFYM